jgi:hypothetical protein
MSTSTSNSIDEGLAGVSRSERERLARVPADLRHRLRTQLLLALAAEQGLHHLWLAVVHADRAE